MSTRYASGMPRFANVAAVALAGVLLGAIGIGYRPAAAQHTPARQTSDASSDLESAFWQCDYAGTRGAVDADTAIACVRITDELKMTKFHGDFMALLAWWREHKPAEHAARSAASRVTPALGMDAERPRRSVGEQRAR